MGTDGVANGLLPKSHKHVRWRPTLLMPGVANIISSDGIKHIYKHMFPIPYNSATDKTLSDVRHETAPQQNAYTLKPYPFTSGKYGKYNIFECDTCACEKKYYMEWMFSNFTCYSSHKSKQNII